MIKIPEGDCAQSITEVDRRCRFGHQKSWLCSPAWKENSNALIQSFPASSEHPVDSRFHAKLPPQFSSGLVLESRGAYAAINDDDVIAAALRIVSKRVATTNVLSNPRATREYLALRFAGLEHEVFASVFLNLCAALTNVHRRCRKTAVRQMSCALLNINAVPGPAAPTPGTFRCR